jgi:regulation of enolase protein 1 (concanavalin A-like superfamily)
MRGRTLALLIGLLALWGVGEPAQAELPSGWTARDIGAPSPPGRTAVEGSGPSAVWAVTGTGSDIWGPADQFQFVYTPLPGDGGVTARLLTQTGGNADGWAKTGTMLRETTAANSRCAYMPYTNGGRFQPSWRLQAGQTPTDNGLGRVGRTLATGPIWIRTQRRGQRFEHLTSNDGETWQLLGVMNVPIPPTKAILAGLCASMHGGNRPVLVRFDNVSVSDEILGPQPSGPSPVQADPGNGTVLLTYGAVEGAVGYNIYRREVGEPTSARVLLNALPHPYTWYTDSGDRDDGPPNGVHYLYSVRGVFKGGGGKLIETRQSPEVMAAPQVELAPGFRLRYWNTTTPATLELRYGMLAFTVNGADIWDVADSGVFFARPATGDYSFSVRIVEKPAADAPNASGNVKAGAMIREGVGPSDRYAFVFTTSGRGVLWEGNRKTRVGGDGSGRYSQEGTVSDETEYPLWLKLTRRGTTVTAYQSNDGASYTPVGDPQFFSQMSANTYAGIAMSSGDRRGTGSVRFDAASLRVE